MKYIIVCIAFCLSAVFMSSCMTFSGKERLAMRIGMPQDSVALLNSDIADGMKKLSGPALAKYGNVEVSVTRVYGPIKLEYYLYAFVNKKLVYWGYPYEFTRSKDPMIESIGVEASRIVSDMIDN